MIESDNQMGFFMARDIPSSPNQASVWFHRKDKIAISSSPGAIPSVIFLCYLVLSTSIKEMIKDVR